MFLGIDPSLVSSGVVLIDSNGKIVIKQTINSSRLGDQIQERFDRYKHIINQLEKLLKEYELQIQCIAIEGYSYGSLGKKDQLYESGALIRNYIINNMLNRKDFIEVSPISLKKFILGTVKSKGKESKNLIIKEIYKKYNLDIDENNEADAFILSKIAKSFFDLKYNKEHQDYFEYQIEVVNNLIGKFK